MAKRNSPKDLIEKTAKQELLPPAFGERGAVSAPKLFETIGDVINEQKRLYKEVFSGKLSINDLSKLMYSLSQIIQGMKAKSEMDVLEDAYIKQWRGVRIIAPDQINDPMQEAIEGELIG